MMSNFETVRRGKSMRVFLAVLAAVMVLMLAPLPASALGVDADDAVSAQAGRDGVSALSAADKHGLVGIDDIKAAAAEKFSAQAGDTGVKALAAPAVDAVIGSLPYSDTRTIDANTHKINIGDILEIGQSLELKGYVYQMAMTKGQAYALSLSGATDEFLPGPLLLDAKGKLLDAYDSTGTGVDSGSVFIVPKKSGTYYIVIVDAMELLMPAVSKGGAYTLTLDRAYGMSGTVKDRKGKPIRGATVELFSTKAVNVDDVCGYATTDKKGRYTIYGVQKGRYKVRFTGPTAKRGNLKYSFEYYGNKKKLKAGKWVHMPADKNKKGVNARLSTYKPPVVDKKIAALPFSSTARITTGTGEVYAPMKGVVRAKVYAVRFEKGRSYELLIDGKELLSPVICIVDSKGYYAGGAVSEMLDKGIAAAPFTVPKTDTYYLMVYDGIFSYGDFEYGFSFGKNARTPMLGGGKYALTVSDGYKGGSISGHVTWAGGYPYDSGADIMVYKKHGENWVSYTSNWSDVNGNYTITDLRAGEYKVEFRSDDTGQRYYKEGNPKGTKDIAKATVIKVTEGRTSKGTDIRF
ncbi:MAG: carboxypeptidase-like regulatory domain-containing protein [Clostridiales Family XIII bacterium]|jgi:hypothetical protein|nr:carboxypeptidase-like regulatory domain-containing protein [Clostridiales Family XIII bacterium]